MDRRTLLGGAALLALAASAGAQERKEERPAAPDPNPLDNELDKYPRCVICNMDRRKFHYARHLLHYGDGHAEGTCSINCAAECMVKERRRGFTAIYGPDYGAAGEPKPLIEVTSATYLIGSDLRGVMSPVSKYAFADPAAADRVKAVAGGEIGTFAGAIGAALDDMAKGVVRRYETDRERLRRRKPEAPA